MPTICFTIPGEPSTTTAQQKGMTGRGIKKRYFTKQAVAAEMRRIRKFARPYKPAVPLDGCIELEIKFVSPLTQEQAERHIDKLCDPTFEIRKKTSPDWDNWPKALCDALAKEGFWTNDSRISDGTTRKRYGSEPRIVITIREVSEIP